MQEFCSKRHETTVIQCEPTNGAKATLEEMSQKMSTNHTVIEFGEDYPKSKYLLNQRINQSTYSLVQEIDQTKVSLKKQTQRASISSEYNSPTGKKYNTKPTNIPKKKHNEI